MLRGFLATADGQGKEARGQRLASQHTGKDRAGLFNHGAGDI